MPGAILAYHLVDSRFDFGLTRVTPGQFRRQMQCLKDDGYRGISIRELVRQSDAEASSDKCIGVTFDDGYASFLDYAAPISNDNGFRGSVFVITDYVGKENRWDVNLFWRRFRHLSWSDLRSLSAEGWEIGSHTCSHAYLPHLGEPELWREVWESKAEIEQQLGEPVESLCLPFGRGSERVFQAIARADYRTVLALGRTYRTNADCRIISRRGVYLFDNLTAFRKKFLAPADDSWQEFRQRFITSFSMGSIIVKRLLPAKSVLPAIVREKA
jgi:peptidoglycan/xylan/chitin deacetylase (PgdA/CDA1 family)